MVYKKMKTKPEGTEQSNRTIINNVFIKELEAGKKLKAVIN